MPHPAETIRVTENQHRENGHILAVYSEHGGYAALEKAVREMAPADVTEVVKASGLRGRGGAGFPAGMKWSFLPKDDPRPRYLVCNADESEPGTFKDRAIMELDPHLLLEGIALAAYAIGARHAFIYIRGELEFAARRLEEAIAEAEAAGFLGKGIVKPGFDLTVIVHRGAGAYICGEESALLTSLEGRRGNPRLKPPFPAQRGVYACPTIVNNVETLANVPLIVKHGADWFREVGTEKSPGTKVFGVSGPVRRPGNYEMALGTPLSVLLDDVCGGMRPGYALKATIPGGSSVPLLPADKVDVPLDFEGVAEAGSMLGCGSVIVIDREMCIVRASLILTRFYHHESCGFCVPCREGTNWMLETLTRIEGGEGRPGDVELLVEICDSILGRSFCPLGDAAATPVKSAVELFREEFDHHIENGTCLPECLPSGAARAVV
jgi:NADH-quinone oxidoreductase subunit F